MGVEEAFGEDAKNWNGKLDAYFDPSDALKVTGMWMFCADNYLAPVYSECNEGAGEGVEGLISYVTCARNLTNAWIAERRPEVTDLMADYWMGGSVYSDDDVNKEN